MTMLRDELILTQVQEAKNPQEESPALVLALKLEVKTNDQGKALWFGHTLKKTN